MWGLGHGAMLRPYAITDLEALWTAVEPERERLGRWLHWANLLASIEDERAWLEMATSPQTAD